MSKEKEKERRREADIRRHIKKSYEDKLQDSSRRIMALEAALKQQERKVRDLQRQNHVLNYIAQEAETNPLTSVRTILNSSLIKTEICEGQGLMPKTYAAVNSKDEPAENTQAAKKKLDFIKDMLFLKKDNLLEAYRIEPGEEGYNLFYSVVNAGDAHLAPAMEAIVAKAEELALQLNKRPIVSYDEAHNLMYQEADIPDDDVVFR